LGDPFEPEVNYSLRPPTVFISYTHKDREHPTLKRLLDDLSFRARVSVWIDSERVTSPWEYLETHRSLDADIVNVVRCRILEVAAVDDIPGKVVACFRPSRTIQRITDSVAVTYTRFLWNKLSGRDDYPLPLLAAPSLFSLLGAETAEDVIFIYLQLQGWLVVPHSRKADTMGFEFVLINRETKERATVQVKTGNTPLDRSEWKDMGAVFLFQANGIYHGEETPQVICLSPEIVLRFVMDNLPLMPAVVQRWAAFVSEHRTQQRVASDAPIAARA